jgi:fermentation-respiration switch protein FrsA (DUF1100 family)
MGWIMQISTHIDWGSIIGVLCAILVTYGILIAGLYWGQRFLMYHPDRKLEGVEHYNAYRLVEISTINKDGLRLVGWISKNWDLSRPILIYFHGNKGHIGDRSDKLNMFAAHWNVVAFQYRGFGRSQGSPSEPALYNDAETVLAWSIDKIIELHQENGTVAPNKEAILANIMFYGESLGTGVALEMAVRYPGAKILVLEAPYRSILVRAKDRFPFVPVEWILNDRFDSESKIANLKLPLLLMHGERDQTIPVADGRVLLEKAPVIKRGIFLPDVAHTNFSVAFLSDQIRYFLTFLAESSD